LSRRRSFVIGGKRDQLSIIQTRNVINSLREIHSRSRFMEVWDLQRGKGSKKGRREIPRTLSGVLRMLMKGELDIVVANAREISLNLQSRLEIAAVPARGNPFDVLISEEDLILDDQPEKSSIAVSDFVRKGQLLYYRPDLLFVKKSGGFESLFRMMEKGKVNGFVIAASDVEDLNQQDKVVEVFTSSICTPVACQGALGLIVRKEDKEAHSMLKEINDPPSAAEVDLERKFLRVVSKNCKGLAGVLANVEGDEFMVEASIASPDGSEKVSGTIKGISGEESKVVEKLVEVLLASGGGRIISEFKRYQGAG
jgi:hydroxymethylbilane synthase